ncbi:hypothetical protein CLV51_11069 [Chitinophaga niastensis]|uniref:Uncharacterized protein n=1 Tax=Chitinophaga niastensis TaxID=536980 RepID=A0A2P8H9D9_CHINA|nr:hypothetical protein [Chitinophaga niastensis]PSL42853.1 hypothetical protein CLV51_11069 [Chitinophaga niastensis]
MRDTSYIDSFTLFLTEIFFESRHNEKVPEELFSPILTKMRNVARFVFSRYQTKFPDNDSQLSLSYSDLKDKHCLLKLKYKNLKSELDLQKQKRIGEHKRSELYYSRYWEIAKFYGYYFSTSDSNKVENSNDPNT